VTVPAGKFLATKGDRGAVVAPGFHLRRVLQQPRARARIHRLVCAGGPARDQNTRAASRSATRRRWKANFDLELASYRVAPGPERVLAPADSRRRPATTGT